MNLLIFCLIFSILFFSCFIVLSRDTIQSLICLIVCFVLSGFCFILLGAEFLAFILIIVYGGAISILFLFIIMLLNLRIISVYNMNRFYLPFCIFFSIFLVLFVCIFLYNNFYFITFNLLQNQDNTFFYWFNYINLFNYKNNLFNFGIVLYNYYYIYIILCALILLLAMLGSIFLVYDQTNDHDGKNFSLLYNKKYKVKILKNYGSF